MTTPDNKISTRRWVRDELSGHVYHDEISQINPLVVFSGVNSVFHAILRNGTLVVPTVDELKTALSTGTPQLLEKFEKNSRT